jgi:glycosyltransferase involved in cell wall biosynthesis
MSYFDLRLGPASLDVSIVIPVRDEAPNVARLAGEVAAAMGPTRWSWECVWVDDGSQDDTLAELTRLSDTDKRHRIVELERNYGQSAALGAGFVASRGAMIATLDGDGQNDPAELARLIGLLVDKKLDLVNSYRERSQFGPIRRVSSKIANAFRNRLTGEHVRDVGCSLRVVRRECLDGVFVFKGMHRFLPTLIRINGYSRMEEVPVRHRARWKGTSKYGISNRLWVGVADTLAVRWMSRRMVAPRVKNASASERQEAFK